MAYRNFERDPVYRFITYGMQVAVTDSANPIFGKNVARPVRPTRTERCRDPRFDRAGRQAIAARHAGLSGEHAAA
ncbi:MAG: hypothetical protein DI544_14525 [Sphingomonas taxi]|uniref:Uncharacterized protein n=1 Tax=Sphingomonas taxi TaxID=1549858 RepID=A0A2W5P2E2_9SPHN|nr:MAG: hypothetical protein DI544_14525 [Sphingomonas taxi]